MILGAWYISEVYQPTLVTSSIRVRGEGLVEPSGLPIADSSDRCLHLFCNGFMACIYATTCTADCSWDYAYESPARRDALDCIDAKCPLSNHMA